MASKSVTKAIPFDFSPAENRNLFTVLEGHDAGLASFQASCLLSGVKNVLMDGLGAEGLKPDVLNLCVFALDAAIALHDATERG